jgi:segregation and condensation protein A
MDNIQQTQLEIPLVMGQPLEKLPDDLFIPPNAFELCLETFSGPMDLLLYLIKKENINILDLNVADITNQYIEYIELMDALKFELAGEYLVMAATLAEIKSRMLLPKPQSEEDELDPRGELIRRLQEYQRFKIASENMAILPRVDRDYYIASAGLPKFEEKTESLNLNPNDLRDIFQEILKRPDLKSSHQIAFEELSTQDKIDFILKILTKRNIVGFYKTLQKKEGKQGVAVSLLASLELAKDGLIELIQSEDNEIYIKSNNRSFN